MKKSTLFFLLSVMVILFSCQKNTRDLESNINSTVKRSVQNTPTDVTSTFDELLDYPINIIVKENSLGKTYLTSDGGMTECYFDTKKGDDSQKFFLRKNANGDLEIYRPNDDLLYSSSVRGSNPARYALFNWSERPIRTRRYEWRILGGGTVHENSYIISNIKYATSMTNAALGNTINSTTTMIGSYSNTGRQEFEIRPIDDFEIVNIEYINDASATISQQPDFITQWFYSNNTSIQQSMSTSFSQRASKTSSFSQTTGGSITLGASVKLKVGVPFANAEATINTSITAKHDATYGKSEVTEDAQTYNFPINVAPRTSVTATATVSRYLINLKYKATLRGINTGKLITVNGVWEGISCTDVKVALVEKSLDTGETLRSTTLSKVPKTTFKF